MIYTSYFANLRNLPDYITPISISAKPPYWYRGLQYSPLAPSYDLLNHWKENGDEEYYTSQYYDECLNNMDTHEFYKDILNLLGIEYGSRETWENIAFICYEKPDTFCHRHLVADWINDGSWIKCKEWEDSDAKKELCRRIN